MRRCVIWIQRTMTDNDMTRLKRGDLVDGGDPLQASGMIGLAKIRMCAIVDSISRHDETYRWYEQTGRVVGVRVADLDGNELVTFQLEPIGADLLGGDKRFRDLAWKPLLPVLGNEFGRNDLAHQG